MSGLPPVERIRIPTGRRGDDLAAALRRLPVVVERSDEFGPPDASRLDIAFGLRTRGSPSGRRGLVVGRAARVLLKLFAPTSELVIVEDATVARHRTRFAGRVISRSDLDDERLMLEVLGVPAGPSPIKRRVVVAGHDFKFVAAIEDAMREWGCVVVRDVWTTGVDHDAARSQALLAWADVVLCEWCLGNAVWYSKRVGERQRLIVRLHRYELDRPFAADVDMAGVGKVVFVSDHIRDAALDRFGWQGHDVTVIPNGVDTGAFTVKKSPTAGRTLGMIGYVPRLKRLDLAIDLLERLRQIEPSFELRLKGHRPEELAWLWSDERQRTWFQEQFARLQPLIEEGSVVVDGFGDDVAGWLPEVGFILSLSDVESFHLGLAEGMASGSVPVILSRPGAEDLWDPRWVFPDVEGAAEFVAAVSAEWDAAGASEADLARAWVSERYDRMDVEDRWRELVGL